MCACACLRAYVRACAYVHVHVYETLCVCVEVRVAMHLSFQCTFRLAIDTAIMLYAKKFHALVIQLEHRYYGKSHPLSDLSIDNLRYLTSEQVRSYRTDFALPTCPSMECSTLDPFIHFPYLFLHTNSPSHTLTFALTHFARVHQGTCGRCQLHLQPSEASPTKHEIRYLWGIVFWCLVCMVPHQISTSRCRGRSNQRSHSRAAQFSRIP